MQIEHAVGQLYHFIVEPFVAHEQSDEYYICIQSHRDGEEILFCAEGGVDVGDVDAKAARLSVDIDDNDTLTPSRIIQALLLATTRRPDERQKVWLRLFTPCLWFTAN